MKCPSCGIEEDRVIDSRPARGGRAVRRRRECSHCGNRFTTYETIAVESLVVVKKDGRREPFDRNKLFAGIEKACQKRPIPHGRLEEIVETIESGLAQRHSPEVPTKEIGEKVMDLLRDLDEVAYVRFASVYRQFKDVSQFMDSIGGILERAADDRKSVGEQEIP